MKIVIEHSQTKRRIDGPFNICGSREDLLRLAGCIQAQAHKDFGYGWVQIFDLPSQQSLHNTPPEEWDQEVQK